MLLVAGENIHVIVRRSFADDIRRHFLGEVVTLDENAVRVRGFTFVYDQNENSYVKRLDRRERIISLVDVGNIINVIPKTVELDDMNYCMSDQNRLVISDGKSYQLDINEFSAIR